MKEKDPDVPLLAEGVARAQATRRGFLKVLAGSAAVAAATRPTPAHASLWEDFFHRHYKRLSPADKRDLIARLEAEGRRRYGVNTHVTDPQPLPRVELGYALNLTACVGCRRCELACAQENNTSREPAVHYIRLQQMDQGSMDEAHSDLTYEGLVPTPGHFYMPVQCHQCRHTPCVRACPVGATWMEPDGVTVIDYDWCIGCRYCEVACPYGARRFNEVEPGLRPSEINPEMGLLSNRLRPAGVMEKCHFCLHRTRRGLYPACLEACPTGSRKFGNLLDPESEVRRVIADKRVYILHEEAGTLPRFYYFFD